MEIWHTLLFVGIAALLIFVFRPGIKAALERSRQAESKDWKGVAIPLALVVLFVIFLLAMI